MTDGVAAIWSRLNSLPGYLRMQEPEKIAAKTEAERARLSLEGRLHSRPSFAYGSGAVAITCCW
jgi:hypothetical protein